MPITITVTADTAAEAQSLMAGLLGSTATTPAQDAAPEKPKATRSTKATAATTTASEPASALSTADASDDAAASPTASTPPSEPVTEASLRARATAYAQKAGPTALIEMQKLAGAANGKMSEIVASVDAMNKLDALLADAGF